MEIKFRATPDEAAKVDRDASERGLSRAAHIRERLGLAPPRPAGAPKGNRNNPAGRAGRKED